MEITNGAVLGPYEIVAPLGAGGMGEVYRARDRRLDRHVALKVLPRRLASSAELRGRFEREARAISALSHPHICSLFDVGTHEGTHYLVMELLEGETLADRLSRGALSIEQALRYGVEIASALDRAHRDGMVHRDLKPGNIMLTKGGAKLLDFGLAKFVAEPPRGESVVAGATEQKPLTAEGTLLGTYQYMSPEQIEGREADARSDIFAFGAVLYEMLTGRRAFEGKSRASLAAAVLSQEPQPISALQPLVPPALERVIRTCLAKDPEDRWQTAHDVMLQLRWIAEGGSQVGAPSAVVSRKRVREHLAWATAALLAVALAATGVTLYQRMHEEAPVLRTALPGRTEQFSEASYRRIAPDGSFLVFTARDENGTRIWRQHLSDTKASPVEGTERGVTGDISPNGRSFLMARDQALFRVDLTGGTPVRLANLPEIWGMTWADDATVIYSHAGALWRVGAAGGKPEKLAAPAGDAQLTWPQMIPGTRTFLYVEMLVFRDPREFRLHAYDLDSRTSRFVTDTSSRTAYSNGHLLAVRDGSVVATPFDLDEWKVTGESKVIADGAYHFKARGDAVFSTSANGLLVYEPAHFERDVRWYDRSGIRVGELAPSLTTHSQPTISPDGRHVAIALLDPKTAIANLWIFGVSRPTRERLAFSDRYEAAPVWTPDRRWIIHLSDRIGSPDIYRRRADGTGSDELLYRAPGLQTPSDVSPDGKWLTFTNSRAGATGSDVMLLSLDDRKAHVFVGTPANEAWPVFSPDGQWLAHTSDESGKSEVYIRPFGEGGEKIQISTGGGTMPKWSRDGRELFYVSGPHVMTANVSEARAGASEPRRLFTLDLPPHYWQLAPDGRFLIITLPESALNRDTHLVANWPALVK